MNDGAASMHVIQTEQDLLSYLFDELHGNAFILVSSDEAQKILPQNFKNHADMCAVGAFMAEMIKERDDMRAAGMGMRRGRGWIGI